MTYLAPRHSDAERLGDAWRITRADLNEAIFWVREYTRYLAKGSMTPSYRLHVERSLAQRLRDYRRLVRQAFEYEVRMDAGGVEFVRS